MKNRNIVVSLSIINLTIVAIFLFDGFGNKKVNSLRIISEKKLEKSASKRGLYSHSSEIIVDNLGYRYNVPIHIYNELIISDQIFIRNSIIFNRPNLFNYSKGGEYKTINVGILNTSIIGIILCGLSSILYLLLLFQPSVFGKADEHYLIAMYGSWFVVIIGAFYYFFQP